MAICTDSQTSQAWRPSEKQLTIVLEAMPSQPNRVQVQHLIEHIQSLMKQTKQYSMHFICWRRHVQQLVNTVQTFNKI